MDRDEILAGVRRVLLADWDPCGVGDNPKLADEYDHYALDIADVLLASPSEASVTAALENAEGELGVTLPEEQRLRTVHSLLKLVSLTE